MKLQTVKRMKKLLILSIFALSIINIVKAQYVDIPDSNFRKFLIKTVPACFNKTGQMDTTCSGVLNQTFLNCSGDSIKDVTGSQYFKNATQLFFSFTKIKSLPNLPEKLTYLWCNNSQLTILPVLPSTLTNLHCEYNQITTLPTLPNSLTEFWCNNNLLTQLPNLPNNLTDIQCGNNQLTTIPNLPNTLITFDCSNNQLKSLPTLPNVLERLGFSNNFLTVSPTLPNSLTSLNCSYNLFNCFPRLPTGVKYLNVVGTGIQYLPNSISSGAITIPANLQIRNSPCTVGNDYSNFINIPDSIFKTYLISYHPTCFNKEGQMDTTCSFIVKDTSFIYQYAYGRDSAKMIQNLEGIQYFKSLRLLQVGFNNLASLPNLSDSLVEIYCSYNKITELPKHLPVNLVSLNCSSNQLTIMPTLPQKLNYFSCDKNKLTILPTLPKTLGSLNCSGNQLTTLPNLPSSLTDLTCNLNKLTLLPNLPDTLMTLSCYSNKLTSLPNLPKKLTYLMVTGNPISSLPALDSLNRLQFLYCKNDSNLNCLPKLPNSIISMDVNGTGIQCLPNYINSTISISPADLPICNPTNNAHQCSAYPTVLGRVFGDDNSNSIKDANEFYIPYVPVRLNTGEISYSNNFGQYALTTRDTGSFAVSATAPTFYKVSPTIFNFRVAEYNDVLTLSDIALQPTVLKDSLSIDIYPLQNAIPGRTMAYAIEYRNVGTTNAISTISFTYDTSKLIFDKASINLMSNTGNTLVWKDTLSADYFGNNFYRNGFRYPSLYFKVKTNAVVGTGLKAIATISSTKTTASIADSIIIRGSYDPNNKEATPQLTTTQVAKGDKIDYLIHFQNVGTASAATVVIADTLSKLLNPSLLQMIGSSHDANVIIDNGVIYFQFLNINLADSGTDQLKSNGFVHFRLNPLTNVKEGTSITNTASIYFDYNSPVVTNIASTLIKNKPLPVSIISYEAKEVLGSNGQIANNWIAANELNLAYYYVQRSVDATSFSNIGQVAAKGNGSYSFLDLNAGSLAKYKTIYYRLQIIDKDGSIRYSKTISVQLTVNSKQLTVYPNPCKNFIVVNGKGVQEIRLIDNLGRVVLSNKLMNVNDAQQRIDFKLCAGIYMAQILSADGSVKSEKVVVE